FAIQSDARTACPHGVRLITVKYIVSLLADNFLRPSILKLPPFCERTKTQSSRTSQNCSSGSSSCARKIWNRHGPGGYRWLAWFAACPAKSDLQYVARRRYAAS